ncbi:MAG: nucleotidyltransferase domain-containing protein [Sedimentisphaerales bacterium]
MKIEHILKEFKEKTAELYGVRLKKVVLYGSYARGQANDEHSDIDLAVVLAGTVKPCREIDRMIDIITDINLDYDVLLSVYPVSEDDYRSVNSPLLLNLRREGIPA